MRLIDADALHEKANGLNWKERSVIQHALRVSPTIEAEPVRHGRWDRGQCTNCKAINPAYNKDWNGDYIFKETPYCPNCGAKMDGDSHAE